MTTELEFLENVIDYCDDMHDRVGRSILDDLRRVFISRRRKLENLNTGGK